MSMPSFINIIILLINKNNNNCYEIDILNPYYTIYIQ